MLPRIELLVADIDGCLVGLGHAAYRLDRVQAVVALQRRSRLEPEVPALTFLSGRPHPYVDALMQLFDVDAPAVFENGAGLARRRPYGAVFDPAVERHRAALGALRDAIAREPDLMLQEGKRASLSVFPRDAAPPPSADRGPAVDAVLARVRATRDALGLDLVLDRSHDCVNVLVPGVDKATGLAWLARETGVPSAAMAGIGDSVGDRAWLAQCALSCAPSAADESVRRAVSIAPELPDIDALLTLYREVILRNGGAPRRAREPRPEGTKA